MIDFFRDMSANVFLQTGLIAGLLASVACGVVGPLVVTRRIVFLAGAIAHASLAGVGGSIFLQHHQPAIFSWFQPIYGALLAALAAAVIIGVVHDRVAERMDTLIGALWAVGMSVGVMLIKYTPGYHAELMSYLFGNLSMVQAGDLWFIAGLDVVILATIAVMYKRLLAVCVDPEQARLQGVNVLAVQITLLCLVALTVISLMQVVGLILVLALLTLPAATAAHHTTRMAAMMSVATCLCLLLCTLPRVAVYGSRLSPESAIVLAAAGGYLLSVAIRRWRAHANGLRVTTTAGGSDR